jgi:hypothetical protein
MVTSLRNYHIHKIIRFELAKREEDGEEEGFNVP